MWPEGALGEGSSDAGESRIRLTPASRSPWSGGEALHRASGQPGVRGEATFPALPTGWGAHSPPLRTVARERPSSQLATAVTAGNKRMEFVMHLGPHYGTQSNNYPESCHSAPHGGSGKPSTAAVWPSWQTVGTLPPLSNSAGLRVVTALWGYFRVSLWRLHRNFFYKKCGI